MEAADIAEKLKRLISKWIRLGWSWVLKSAKIGIQEFRLRKARKNLDWRMSRLGAEFYLLHCRGETEFLKSLVILQRLKIVEEAESQKSTIQDRIAAIEEDYRRRKQAIAGGNKTGPRPFVKAIRHITAGRSPTGLPVSCPTREAGPQG